MLLSYVKRGAYNSFIYSISGIFIRIVSFLFFPYFLSRLTLTEIGIWEFYQLFFSQGTLLLVSCAAISMTRFFLLYKDDPLKQQQAMGNAFLFVLVNALLAPCLIFGSLYFNIFSLSSDYIIITIFSVSFFGLFSMVLSFLRVTEKLWLYLALFCGQNFLAIIGTLIGVIYNFGIKSFFYANLVSFFIFMPIFFHLFLKNCKFSKTIFKEQLIYSIPLLAYSVIYTGFSSVDRLCIQNFLGYEALGIYALLWKFGGIFQIVSIAMIDASPVIFYNAQKEENGNFLISKLITYFCIMLTSCCLLAIFVARCAIAIAFPYKYFFLINYLPLFFLPLIILEIARIVQTGFGLALKTFYVPILSLIALCVQTSTLFFLCSYNLPGILAGNALAFLFYAIISYYTCSKIYTHTIIDSKKIATLCILFIMYIITFNLLFIHTAPWYYSFILLTSWPFALLMSTIITSDEKKWLTNLITQKTKNFIQIFCSRTLDTKTSFGTILYLRTDICSQEIKTGGSITHTLGVINGFLHTGSKIMCASSAMKSILKTTPNITFIPLRVWPIFCFMRWKLGYLRWHLDCFFSTFFFALQIKKLFKCEKINAIYQRYSLLNFTGVLLSRLKKIPLILEYNGSEVWVFRIWAEKQWLHLMGLAKIIEYINLHSADYIVVVSQALKDELILRNINAHKILVNPNGVDTEQFNPENLVRQRTALHKQYGLEDKFVFGFIGTFSYWHGIELLAQVIPEVIKQEPHAHFMLIGDGVLKKYLEIELQKQHITLDNVTFTGAIPHHKAKEFLAACDAFLSPTQPNADGTRFFGSPTKIFEYLSMGKPIIASDLEQLSEIINPAFKIENFNNAITVNHEIGFMMHPENVEHFIQAACLLSNLSESDLQKMRTNARKKALENYTWNQHTQNIQQFILKKNIAFKEIKRERYA